MPLLLLCLLLIVADVRSVVDARAVLHKDGCDTYTAVLHLATLQEGNNTVTLFGDAVFDAVSDAEVVPRDVAANAPGLRLVVEDRVVVQAVIVAFTGHLGPFRLRLSADKSILDDEDDVREANMARELSSHGSLDEASQPRRSQPLIDHFSDHSIAEHEIAFQTNIALNLLAMPDYFVRCDIFVRRMTHFESTLRVADLPDGEPVEMAPKNATFGVRFIVKKDTVAQSVGMWVRRRPPIPPLLLRISNVLPRQRGHSHTTAGAVTDSPLDARDIPVNMTTGEVSLSEEQLSTFEIVTRAILDVHPRGMGTDNCLAMWQQEGLDVAAEVKRTGRMLAGTRVITALDDLVLRIRVEFEEFSRERHALFQVPNAESMLAKLRLQDGSSITLDPVEAVHPSPAAAGARSSSQPTVEASDIDEETDLLHDVVLTRANEMRVGEASEVDRDVMDAVRTRKLLRQRSPLRLRLQYFAHTDHIALMVLQRRPIGNIQVHVVDAANDTVFLEEEWHVPHLHEEHVDGTLDVETQQQQHAAKGRGAHARTLHFGWFHFMHISGQRLRRMTGKRLDFHVFYNEVPHERHVSLADDERDDVVIDSVRDWLALHGATGIDRVSPSRGLQRAWGLVLGSTPQSLPVGSVVASIPWTTVITVDKVRASMRQQFEQLILSEALERFMAKWSAPTRRGSRDEDNPDEIAEAVDAATPSLVREFALRVSDVELMLVQLTAFLLAQPEDLTEGIRFHIFRDAMELEVGVHGFVDDRLLFMPILADDIARILPPSMSFVARMANALSDLIDDEYRMLADAWPWFAERIEKDDFYRMRISVGARAFYDSNGKAMLIPLADWAHHSDEPTVRLEFNAEAEAIDVVAVKPLKAGKKISLDHGYSKHTKLSFWATFGLTSQSAEDVVDVRGVLLSAVRKRSRNPLLNGLLGGSLERFRDELESRLAELPRYVPHSSAVERESELRYPAARPAIIIAANELLAGMRRALKAHLQWVDEDEARAMPTLSAPTGARDEI